MPRFVTCGPNEAIIVSGCCHSTPIIRPGGRVFVWPMFHRIQRLSLTTMTLNVESQKVYSDGGVPVTLKGVAQVKVQSNDLNSLRLACEMFLDKTETDIINIANYTLDGHQRSKIASMNVEDIYKQRNEFAKHVRDAAHADLLSMGLSLVSYTVQDISDDEGYLDALGQSKTVTVRSEARREVAIAKAFSDTKNMETEQSKKEREIQHEQTVAMKQLDFEMAQAKYLKEHFENQAKSEKAGDLQLASMNQLIARQEFEVVLLEKHKETELIKKKKALKALELTDTVERKADYECQREIQLAQAYEEKTKAEAIIEANKIKKLAEARAEMIKEQRDAEAEVLRERAQAFLQFGNAAKLEMVLAILPRLTAEIAGPITECKKITSVSQDGSVGFSRITNEVFEVVERMCESVSHVTGNSISQGIISNTNDDSAGPGPRKSSTESIPATTSLAERTRMLSSFGSRVGRS